MSKTGGDNLLESINNVSTGGISNPSTPSNGSILLGPDSPKSVHRVTFALEPTDTNSELSESIADSLRQRESCACGDHCLLLHNFADTRAVARLLNTLVYESHSMNMAEASTDVEANITSFSDDNAGFEAGFISARDDTYYVADSDEFDISKFFSRPVRISSTSWTVGTAFTPISLQVFKLFWQNKRNINRLCNYRNMKCDMCVKILINGTPFHYGFLMASVLPDTRFDSFVNTDLTEAGCVRASQNPHILLDPTSSTGGCLRLPYTHSYNCFNVTIATELDNAGTLQIRELVGLSHVSGTIEPITISVLAWAENVVLGAPTAVNPAGLIAQSGDEYGEGVISRPAFILAKIAGSLRNVPFIGPYAMSTSMGARNLGKIAQIFGHVKPNIVSDINFINPRFQPNLASATQHDPIFKGTLDDKQETTIDPRVVGLTGRDEMSIVDLAMRESYLTQFAWTQTGAVDSRLFSISVNPNLYRVVGAGNNAQYLQTPMSWLAQPFQFWRGTLRFRFTAAASTFHRGRIRIVYDPGAALGATLTDFNTNLTQIWDLSESKEMVVDVGWHQPFSYSPVSNISDAVQTFSTVATIVSNAFDNGSLALYVMTELTAPDTNLASPITILVSVSAGEDFEVFSPQDTLSNFEYFAQSGSTLQEIEFSPHRRPADVVFGNKLRDDATAAIYHGDPVVSLRTLLKRYTLSSTHGQVGLTAASRYSWKLNLPHFPLYPGRAPLAIHSSTTPINFVQTTLLNHYTPAFLARRGGVRHRFIQGATDVDFQNVTIMRAVGGGYTNTLTAMAAFANPINIARENRAVHFTVRNGTSGQNITPNFRDTGIDIELPYHVNRRYWPGRTGAPNDPLHTNQGVFLLAKFFQAIAGFPAVTVDHFVSAADDFCLIGFIDVPIMYVHTTVPPAL